MFNFRHDWLALFALTGIAFGVAPAHAQTALVTRPVTVAVLENYPLLVRSSEHDSASARPFSALAIRRAPTGGDTAVILVSPAYLNASTLGAALETLRSCTGGPKGLPLPNHMVITTARASRRLDAITASALDSRLAKLRAQPIIHHYKLAAKGRSITIADALVCVPVPEIPETVTRR